LEELARGLLGLIEFALVDKIDDGVGVAGEFVLLIIGTVEVALVLGSLCGVGLGSRLQRRALGLLILCEAAALVFLPATAGAGSLRPGLAMMKVMSDVSAVAGRCGILPAVAALR